MLDFADMAKALLVAVAICIGFAVLLVVVLLASLLGELLWWILLPVTVFALIVVVAYNVIHKNKN